MIWDETCLFGAQDPILLANATGSFGSTVTGVPGVPAIFAKGGGNQILSQAATFISYRSVSSHIRASSHVGSSAKWLLALICGEHRNFEMFICVRDGNKRMPTKLIALGASAFVWAQRP